MKNLTSCLLLFLAGLLTVPAVLSAQCTCYESEDAPGGVLIQCENFSAYSYGNISPQSELWNLWSSGSDDAVVALVPSTESKGLKVERTSTADPDVLYTLGNRTSGRYRLSWSMYIASGKGGYYNIQHAHENWAYHVYFNSDGTGRLRLGNQPSGSYHASFYYTGGAWNRVMQILDLDKDIAELWINDNFVYSWKFSTGTSTLKQLGSINFYANTGNLFYVDNICLRKADPLCLVPSIYAPVCVKNGTGYSNSYAARCDLYRSLEWQTGLCHGDFCSKAVTVQCDQFLANQTTRNAGNALDINSYRGCLPSSTSQYTGAEKVYKIAVPPASQLQIGLENLSGDQDIFLLDDDCNIVTCLDYSAAHSPYEDFEGIIYPEAGGTYYVVIDAYHPEFNGNFHIDFACGYLDCASAQTLTCNVPYTSNTNLGRNNVSVYDIIADMGSDVIGPNKGFDVMNSGPERIHKFTLTTAQTVTITLGGLTSDLELFLLNACSNLKCIGRSVNKGTTSETITTFLNPGTYYVIVDGYNDASGPYTLRVACGDTSCACYETETEMNGKVVLCDDFETYSSGTGIAAQSSNKWKLRVSGADDAVVSGSPSGSGKVLKVERTSSVDPDVLLLLGNRTSGRYRLSWRMYAISGRSGYYNVQHAELPGSIAYEVTFNGSGSGSLKLGNQSPGDIVANFSYLNNAWNQVMQIIDLDKNVAEFWINDNFIHSWTFSLGSGGMQNQLGAVNFYAASNNFYYIDNICLRAQDLSTCVAITLYDPVCVKNGQGYSNGALATCDLYRPAEWTRGVCQTFCDKATLIQCGDYLDNQTTVGAGNLLTGNSYRNCADSLIPYSASEKVYKIVMPVAYMLQVGLENIDGKDLDLLILDDSCRLIRCYYSSTSINAVVNGHEGVLVPEAGLATYYIVVDGKYPGDEGRFRLDVACGGFTANDAASAPVLQCGVSYSSNTNTGQNGVSVYGLTPDVPTEVIGKNLDVMNSGPERLHKFTLTQAQTVTLSLTGLSADLELFLMDNYSPWYHVIAKSTNRGTVSESITKSLAAGTYYVAVDGYNKAVSAYSLKLLCGLDCSCYETDTLLAGNLVLCESFENYTVGSGIAAQASGKWNLAGTIDAPVAARPGGTGKALKFERTTLLDPSVLLLLGNRTSGRYRLSWQMYVSSGKAATYSIQHAQNSENLACRAIFNANGSGSLYVGNLLSASFNYTNGGWNRIMQIVDLDKDVAELWINDQFILAWPFSIGAAGAQKQLGALHFYTQTNNLYYIDDICLREKDASTCSYILLYAPVCVKNGTTYTNHAQARCDLYQSVEWTQGACTTFCQKATQIQCGQILSNQTTVGAGNQLTGIHYADCLDAYHSYAAPERVYKVSVPPGTSYLQIGMELLDAVDLDLFLLDDSCNVVACLDGSISSNPRVGSKEGIVWTEPSGTYYIVVDGKSPGAEGRFNLDVACGSFTSSDERAAPLIACGATYSSNTSLDDNDVSVYGLKTGVASDVPGKMLDVMNSGPDKVHKFSLDQEQTVTITLSGLTSNLELFLLDTLQWDNVIAKSTNTGAASETITMLLPAGLYYVVVDGYNGASGSYTLKLLCSLSCACYEAPEETGGKLVLCDDFESYTINNPLVGQAAGKWQLTTTTSDDALVASASPGGNPNALKVEQTVTSSPDVLFLLGNRTSGRFRLSWLMNISNNNQTGYYAIQHAQTPGNKAYEVQFNLNGAGRVNVGSGQISDTFSYQPGVWTRVMQIIDLDQNVAELWINDNFVSSWAFDLGSAGKQKQLGAIQFFSLANTRYYADKICLLEADPACRVLLIEDPVCVKNGKTYVNPSAAKCALYRQEEWIKGRCCPDTPEEDANCSRLTYDYAGDGTDLTFTFTSGGLAVPLDENWTIGNQTIDAPGATSVTYGFPGGSGVYKVCFTYLDDQGCRVKCCKNIMIDNPYSSSTIRFKYFPDQNAYAVSLPPGQYSNVEWKTVEDGIKLTVKTSVEIDVDFPGNCPPATIVAKFYDLSCACWKEERIRVQLCPPGECASFDYKYVDAGPQPGYQFVLNEADAEPSSITWWVDETDQNLSNGTRISDILPVPSDCRSFKIWVRYYQKSNRSWYICWRQLLICNPFGDGSKFIKYIYDATRNAYEFTLDSANYPIVQWKVEELDLALGSGNKVLWQTSLCGSYVVSARYYDPDCRCWKLSSRRVYICAPFNCSQVIIHQYVNGQLRLSVDPNFTKVTWTSANGLQILGTGNNIVYDFPGGIIQVCVNYFDPSANAWRTCCKTISTGPPLPNLTTSGTPAASVNGTEVNVQMQVVNNGSGIAASSAIRFYLNSDTSQGVFTVGLSSLPSMGVNQRQQVEFSVDVARLFQPVPEGRYRIGYCLDANNQVPETNESDNCVLFENLFVQVPAAAEPFLDAGPGLVQVSADSGNFTLNIFSNVTWLASDSASWLWVSPSTGFGNWTLQVVYLENTTSEPRMTSIIVAGGGINKIITLIQEGRLSDAPVLDIENNICGSQGDTVQVAVRALNFRNIVGLQMSFQLEDAEAGSLRKPRQFGLPYIDTINFGLPGSSVLTMSWISLQPVTLPDSSVLFYIPVILEGATGQTSSIAVANVPTSIEIIQFTGVDYIPVPAQFYPGSICIEATAFSISGLIAREDRTGLEGVKVTLSGGANQTTYTDRLGNYLFTNLPARQNYIVSPANNRNHRNGVSGSDMFLIQRHIIGYEPLNSPYKLIAADVNKSKLITGGDLFSLQRLILGVDTAFTANTSWRFVPRSYSFKNPSNPFAEDFPEVLTISNLQASIRDADFTGIKVGDVNQTSMTSGLENLQRVSLPKAEALEIHTPDILLEAGEVVEAVFYNSKSALLGGFQFTLDMPENWIEIIEITPGKIPALRLEDYGLFDRAATLLWVDPEAAGLQVDAGSELFRIKFLVKGQGNNHWLSEALGLSSSITPVEAFGPDAHTRDVRMKFMDTPDGKLLLLHRIIPNPVAGSAVLSIRFNGDPEPAVVDFRDNLGRLLYTYRLDLVPGNNQLALDFSTGSFSGMLTYEIRYSGGKASGKVLILQ